DEDREWAAMLMAGSEPWIRLGRGLERCLQVCRDPEYLVFIARREAERYGVLILQARGVAGSPYIVSLAVAPHLRGKGVGGRLLTFAEELFAKDSAHQFLCVYSFYVRGRRFSERHGFRISAAVLGYVV